MIPLIRSSPPGGHQSPPDRGVRGTGAGRCEKNQMVLWHQQRHLSLSNVLIYDYSTWNLGSHSFEYCCQCQLALQVSCLMCFVPQLIERNLYADDRFIPTDWVGLPSLFSALYLVGRFLTPKKFLVNWETFFHHLKNL